MTIDGQDPRRVERKLGQFEEQPEPAWRMRALEHLSSGDRQAVMDIRNSMARFFGPNQTWYQSDARTDLTASMLAPPSTKHWRVDPVYNAQSFSHHYQPNGKEDYARQLVLPHKELGAQVEIALPWQDAWQKGRQGMRLTGGTIFEMRGGHRNDPTTMPRSMDVIYDAYGSPQIGSELLKRLTLGGIILAEAPKGFRPGMPLSDIGRELTSMGFSAEGRAYVNDLYIPAMRLSEPRKLYHEQDHAHGVRSLYLSVYQKKRELSVYDELDIEFACAMEDLHRTLPLFLRTGDQRLVVDLEGSLRRLFDAIIVQARHPQIDVRIRKLEERYTQSHGKDYPVGLLNVCNRLSKDAFVGASTALSRIGEFSDRYYTLKSEYSRKGLRV